MRNLTIASALLALAACAEPTTPVPPEFTLVDIHTLSEFHDCRSEATALNAQGLVVGTLRCGLGQRENAFVYQDGLIGLLSNGSRELLALDVNEVGQILVRGDTAAPPIASAIYASWITSVADLTARAYRPIHARALNAAGDLAGNVRGPFDSAGAWIGGTTIALGTLGGRVSGALDINDAGAVAGWSETADFRAVPVRWSGGTATALDVPAGRTGIAAAINASGVATGWTIIEFLELGGGQPRPARWDGTTHTALPTLGGDAGWAYDINDAGDIVGATLTADGFLHATLWRNGEALDLGVLEGETESTAVRIAADGSIAGRSGGRAVVWRRN